MINEKYWIHPQYNRHFGGKYITKRKKRFFLLDGLDNRLAYVSHKFKSHQEAKKNGWELKYYDEIISIKSEK